MREHLGRAGKLYYRYQKQGWFLDAVEIYCGAIIRFREDMARNSPQSRGLRSFREYLDEYVDSRRFAPLVAEMQTVKAGLRAVRYSMLIKGDQIKVRKYESESDYSASVEKTFEKFQQDAAKDYRVEFANPIDMNHIEAGVLVLVAQLYPEAFQALDR
ncbi:MAG TPA: DNA mismatch repair protein MutS, partial [Bradyrhizobium sp.]|nr:DNA mismatch repair protein MutS [Bradyrhizobium sp.]